MTDKNRGPSDLPQVMWTQLSLTSYRTGGIPSSSNSSVTEHRVNENLHGGAMCVPPVGDKARDSWEICGLAFMRMPLLLGSVLIWGVC